MDAPIVVENYLAIRVILRTEASWSRLELMQGLLDGVEKILEIHNQFLITWFIVPACRVLTKFTVENLEAASERASKGPRRVKHFSDKARANPPGHSDSCCVHLG